MVVRKLSDIEPIEEILSIHNILPEAPKTLAEIAPASAGHDL